MEFWIFRMGDFGNLVFLHEKTCASLKKPTKAESNATIESAALSIPTPLFMPDSSQDNRLG
jgi:hypothetical protein